MNKDIRCLTVHGNTDYQTNHSLAIRRFPSSLSQSNKYRGGSKVMISNLCRLTKSHFENGVEHVINPGPLLVSLQCQYGCCGPNRIVSLAGPEQNVLEALLPSLQI